MTYYLCILPASHLKYEFFSNSAALNKHLISCPDNDSGCSAGLFCHFCEFILYTLAVVCFLKHLDL